MRTSWSEARPRWAVAGFSAVELMIVLMIVVMLASIAVPEFGRMRHEREVRNARDALVLLAARARLEALKQGQPVLLRLLPDSGVARVSTLSGVMIDQVYFAGDHKATVATSNGGQVQVCYSARGFALQSCTPTVLPVDVRFAKGAHRAHARIRPLGQVEGI